jgi:hypothetical protein
VAGALVPGQSSPRRSECSRGRRPSTTCVTRRRPITHRRRITRRDITRRRIILGHAEPARLAALT